MYIQYTLCTKKLTNICSIYTLITVYAPSIMETTRRSDIVPVIYKIDIISALKEKGYSTYKLRKEKLLAEGVIQSLREGKAVSLDNIGRLCALLDCQPGDLLVYADDT